MTQFTELLSSMRNTAAAELETAAPRLNPRERARRDASRQKDLAQRAAANAKRRLAALTKRRTRLQEQLDKAVARTVKLRDALKETDAALKSNAKGK